MKTRAVRMMVPIYEAELHIVVADDLGRARKEWAPVFGEFECEGNSALCSWVGHRFGLFFERGVLASRGYEVVAHETFHLTHRILEWSGTNFDSTHHEHAALLHGWLMREVMGALGAKWRAK